MNYIWKRLEDMLVCGRIKYFIRNLEYTKLKPAISESVITAQAQSTILNRIDRKVYKTRFVNDHVRVLGTLAGMAG